MEAVRPAVPGDLVRCTELLAAARVEGRRRRGGEHLADLGGGPDAPAPDDERVVEHWATRSADRLLLVGLFEGAVVGIGAGRTVEPAGGGSRRPGRIDCCYVEPGYRKVGVGGALIEGLLAWFAARACSDVDALALPGDRDTKQLYETAGFKARLLVLHRSIG